MLLVIVFIFINCEYSLVRGIQQEFFRYLMDGGTDGWMINCSLDRSCVGWFGKYIIYNI